MVEAADSSANPAKALLTSRQFYLSPPCGERSPRKRGEGTKGVRQTLLPRLSWLAPPAVGQKAEQGRARRMVDRGAARYPLLRQVEQRHHIGAGDEHAVERTHRGDKVRALAGAKERRDHGV